MWISLGGWEVFGYALSNQENVASPIAKIDNSLMMSVSRDTLI